MPRGIRYILPNIPHHVVQRGNNKQAIFWDDEDKEGFIFNLKRYSSRENVLVGAYCLMTNHVHLLLYPQQPEGLIKIMKFLSQLHTQNINRKYNRTGKLWENRYKLHLVDPEYEWIVARYIEMNPVRAGIITDAWDYRYSSARCHLLGYKDGIISKDIIQRRGDDYKKYFSEAEANDDKHLKMIRMMIQQEKALGKAGFIKDLETRFKTSFEIRSRGRPKGGEGENRCDPFNG